MYFSEDKRKSYPRICGMKNPKAANEMIVTLAAGYLAGGHIESSNPVSLAIHEAALAVEQMLRTITGEDELPSIDHLLIDTDASKLFGDDVDPDDGIQSPAEGI